GPWNGSSVAASGGAGSGVLRSFTGKASMRSMSSSSSSSICRVGLGVSAGRFDDFAIKPLLERSRRRGVHTRPRGCVRQSSPGQRGRRIVARMAERFYINCPLQVGPVTLEGPEAHHLATVRRFAPGDMVCLFNGDGREYPARVVSVRRRAVALEITRITDPQRELPFHL